MSKISKNINIGWYGGCKTCKDFDFYKENGTLVDGFANVISVIQVKSSGYVFVSWSAEKNEKQKKIWANLPQNVRDSLDRKKFIQENQGIVKFQCGTPYLIEIEEGTEFDLPEFSVTSKSKGDSGRVIECFDCPTFPPCVCE
tara:strand:- start:3362 stop:3787 length:426 start_codon:yes stop_codon:yes gene_type:complete